MLSSNVYSRRTYASTDALSHLRPAGLITEADQNASKCLNWGERPPTPPGMKKYRQSIIHEPGRIVKHYGFADDPVPDGIFGITTPEGESADKTMKCFPDSDIMRWKLQQAETIYDSSKREPLGKSYVRGHNIPPELGTVKPFGKAINAQELEKSQQARHIIFPVDRSPEEDHQSRRLYVRSHGSYGAGEQRQRGYDWQTATIKPDEFRFGAVPATATEDVKSCLVHNDLLEDKLVNRVYEDWKLTQADILGRPKVLGAKLEAPPPDNTFGARSAPVPEPGVGELIGGLYHPGEQEPDADLGKSIREGWRNIGPSDKVFGIPSIRTDIPKPRTTKVTCAVNYGGDPRIGQLLSPAKPDVLGISQDLLNKLMDKGEIRQYLTDSAICITEAELSRSFRTAAQADSKTADRCSLNTFLHVRRTTK